MSLRLRSAPMIGLDDDYFKPMNGDGGKVCWTAGLHLEKINNVVQLILSAAVDTVKQSSV